MVAFFSGVSVPAGCAGLRTDVWRHLWCAARLNVRMRCRWSCSGGNRRPRDALGESTEAQPPPFINAGVQTLAARSTFTPSVTLTPIGVDIAVLPPADPELTRRQ